VFIIFGYHIHHINQYKDTLMAWVIAILLALILVAMMSSNKDAAGGVFKVVHIALFMTWLLIPWLIYISWTIWYVLNNPDQNEWFHYLLIGLALLVPPVIIWLNKNHLINQFKENKISAYKLVGQFILVLSACFLFAVVFHHLKIEYPNIGWVILISGLLITGLMLIAKESNQGKSIKQVFTANPLDDPWERACKEIEPLEFQNEAAYKKALDQWESLSIDEQFDIEDKYSNTKVQLEHKCRELEKKYSQNRNENYLGQAFWGFAVFIIFGLIGVIWDISYEIALSLDFVKGNEWEARGVVLLGFLSIMGAVGAITDEIKKRKSE